MIEIVAEHARESAAQELRFLQAVRLAVPACLDANARRPFEQREAALLKQINT